MNKERLRAVRAAIVEHHERFMYHVPFYGTYAGELLDGNGHRLTCGCVAAFTCAIVNPRHSGSVLAKAGRELELNHRERDFLFHCHAGFGIPLMKISDATWQDAVRRIDILLEQG